MTRGRHHSVFVNNGIQHGGQSSDQNLYEVKYTMPKLVEYQIWGLLR